MAYDKENPGNRISDHRAFTLSGCMLLLILDLVQQFLGFLPKLIVVFVFF